MSSLIHRGLRGTLARTRSGAVSESPAAAVPGNLGRFVLVVDTQWPQPERDSGSLRMVQLLRLLRELGWPVVFMGDDGDGDAAARERLTALGVHCLTGSRGRRLAWLQEHRDDLAAAILSRHHAAGHWLPTLRLMAPAARLIFDSVDLHFLREQREADANGSFAQRLLARWTRRRERRLFRRADHGWVVSQVEQALLRQLVPDADVTIVSNIVDPRDSTPGFPGRNGLLFVGAYGHRPNVDAVEWLLAEILPHVQARLPQVTLHLVGGGMPQWLQQRAQALPGVRVHGHVPELEPLLDQARVGLAPLRFGAGVKGKVNQSLANGLPMVATRVAVEGMTLRDATEILVADDGASFAAQIVRLHEDAALWQRLADNGRRHMRAHFSREQAKSVVARSLPSA
ncbi:MAG: glycosyltransferase family 4 protein [Pseudoxanthomonas suwonensis]|nr:glycosyltransferase family 4 protein [Pseudoxanthomonas suwonensis]